MMPDETQPAIQWVLTQSFTNDNEDTLTISKDYPIQLVDKVRDYFNTNNIVYSTFSYDDLVIYL